MHIDFKGESLNNLLIKFNYYKGKFLRSPQQIMYEKLLEIYKYNQDEHIKMEKYMLRSKKKTISYLVPTTNKRTVKYLWDDFLRDEEAKEAKRQEAARKLVYFDEIYQSKLEKEQQEKARQSVYEIKSHNPLISASNKGGQSPDKERKGAFKFGAGAESEIDMSE